ncbi:putative glycoprotein 3-alpha-L-fucosyltransferase A-like [Apostichopus japonicus]|uniref:Fucosyltransferase n=1 Tax=Stichopus japonicus TaxID=307972 RepID=A0A2G8LGR6_STIJA|nr:putative glycoprotein 3-alpha-L-fucosyltransferase A-like [Apostichopus japonicus]
MPNICRIPRHILSRYTPKVTMLMGSIKSCFHRLWLILVLCLSVFLVIYHHDKVTLPIYVARPKKVSGIHHSTDEFHPGKTHRNTNKANKRIEDAEIGSNKISVGYFEGLRTYWVYERLFQPFNSQIYCNCSQVGTVSKRMFKKTSEMGSFDIVVFPYDVAIAPGIDDNWKRILKQRHGLQRWVYATRETPSKLRNSLIPKPLTKKTYHWSCTYRSNSDITIPYGYFKRYEKPQRATTLNWAENKTGLVAWMSTNSAKQWNRKGFVETLSSLVDIDIYGGPTGISCPRNSSVCDKKIQSHKFYLALENSCCKEYISEKLWRTLILNTVPIVIGPQKRDYLNLAPPNSFIYADDFESMQDLVSYLKYVDSNDTLYNEYFKWREVGYVINLSSETAAPIIAGANEPPPGIYYSCYSACKMADLYRTDKMEKRHKQHFFNPRSKQWMGSCEPCAKHNWISHFEYEVT